jgi:hypothetical protein
VTIVNLKNINVAIVNVKNINVTIVNVKNINVTIVNVKHIDVTIVNVKNINVTIVNVKNINVTIVNVKNINVTIVNVKHIDVTIVNVKNINVTIVNVKNVNVTIVIVVQWDVVVQQSPSLAGSPRGRMPHILEELSTTAPSVYQCLPTDTKSRLLASPPCWPRRPGKMSYDRIETMSCTLGAPWIASGGGAPTYHILDTRGGSRPPRDFEVLGGCLDPPGLF